MSTETRTRAERILLLVGVFVAPLLYLGWQALADPRVEFLTPSPHADWALHPSEGVQNVRGDPTSRDLVFSHRFQLVEVPERLVLRYRAFTRARFELNGRPLAAKPPRSWKRTAEVDLAPALRPGRNTLSIRVHNPGAVPALLITSPAWLRTPTGWDVALAEDPDSLEPAAPPRTSAPRFYAFFREGASPLARLVGRPLYDVLVGAWLAAVGCGGLLVGWRWYRGPGPTPRPRRGRDWPWIPALLVLSLLLQLANAFEYPPQRSYVDWRDHADYVREIANDFVPPGARDGFQMYQPPAYYWSAAVVYRLFGGDAEEEGRALEAVQYLGALAGFSLVVVTWLLARRCFDDTASRLVATAFAACLPMLLYTSPTLSNETFAAATTGFALLALWDGQRRFSPARAAVAGLLCGLALLSKYSGLFVTVAGAILLLHPASGTFRIRWRPLLSFLGAVLIVCGWLYLRNWIAFGDPFVGNWDEASGFHYEQDPGYRDLGFYTRFGRVFVQPIENAPWLSFADGLYATFWGEAFRSFLNPGDDRVKVVVGLLLVLAAWPSMLMLLGFVETTRRAFRRPFADEEFLLLSVPVWSGFALASFTMEVPFYSTVKAFFLLSLVPLLGILLARGRRMSMASPRPLRVAGDAVLLALVMLSLVAYRYEPGPPLPSGREIALGLRPPCRLGSAGSEVAVGDGAAHDTTADREARVSGPWVGSGTGRPPLSRDRSSG